MKKLHKGLIAGAVGLAVLVPTGIAVADTTTSAVRPFCTEAQRQEHWATRDQLRTQILDQLAKEGITDPTQVREQLQTRLHDAMEAQFGEMPGPHAGRGMGAGHMAGSGYGRGANGS